MEPSLDNREVIQNHRFLEVGSWNKALFWEDAWKQRPDLNNDHFRQIRISMKNKGKNRVNRYWKPNNGSDNWREWLDEKDWEPPTSPLEWKELK